MYPFTVLETGSRNQGVRRARLPPWALGRNLALPQLCRHSLVPRLVDASLQSLLPPSRDGLPCVSQHLHMASLSLHTSSLL